MSLVDAIRELRRQVRRYAEAFDADLVSAADAQRIVEHAAAIEKSAAAVKATAAARAAETEVWRGEGDKSAAHRLARTSGIGVGAAREALEAGKKLKELPEVAAAARSGELSPQQTAAIADAASADPSAEKRLVKKAGRSSLGELRDECARTKAAKTDQEQQRRRIHAGRYLRRRTTPDGAGELYYRSTLDELAQIWAVVQGFADKAFRKARAEGRHENPDAYAADGLLAMAHAAAGSAGPAGTGGPETGDPGTGDSRDAAPDPPAGTGGSAAGGSGTGDSGAAGADGAAGGTGDSRPGARDGSAGAGGSGAGGSGTGDSGVAGADAAAGGTDAGGDTESGGDRAGGTDAGGDTESGGDRAGGGQASGEHRERGDSGKRQLRLPPPAGGASPADGNGRLPVPATLIFRIDWDAFIRGWPIEGEMCEIAGVGPVPVSLVETMIATGDPFLAAVVTKGTDVVNVAHLGRRHTARQRTALAWRDPMCVVEGCGATVGLERDHRHDWADTKVTLVSWSDMLCSHHHDLKTHQKWALVSGVGKRPMVPPDHPDHPGDDPPDTPLAPTTSPPPRSGTQPASGPGTPRGSPPGRPPRAPDAGTSPGRPPARRGADTPPAGSATPEPGRSPPSTLFDEDGTTAA